MNTTVNTILDHLNEIAPFSLAESWDNCGLLVGSRSAKVSSILVSLDPAMAIIDEAYECGCDTVVTHHPIIFKPLPSIDTDTPTGKVLEQALSRKINIIACHTNLDNARYGVSDILGKKLGLEKMVPLIPAEDPGTGSGCIGQTTPIGGKMFIKKMMKALDLDTIRVGGMIPEEISTVALCGGSGSGFSEKAQESGADIYVTAEVKHSTARWAEEAGFCVVDATHYSTEKFAVNLLCEILEKGTEQNGWNITIRKSRTERHPFTAIHKDSPV